MFQINNLAINQPLTQTNSGGLTEFYLDGGTYQKSFYTVIFAPNCTKVALMGAVNPRLHHRISWDNALPKIIEEKYKKIAKDTKNTKSLKSLKKKEKGE